MDVEQEAEARALAAFVLFRKAVKKARLAAARLYQAEHNEDGSYYYMADWYQGPAEDAPEKAKLVWQRSTEYGAALQEEADAELALRPHLRRSF